MTATDPRVDIYVPRQDIRIDTMFWQHRSPFVGAQEQLNELRRDANQRAADRAVADFTAFIHARQARFEESVFVATGPSSDDSYPSSWLGCSHSSEPKPNANAETHGPATT